MTHAWLPDPQIKVEVGGTEVEDKSLMAQVTRPINNVSFAVLSVNDYKSKNYIGVFDALSALDISFRYGSDSWTKVFSGTISTVAPRLGLPLGEILEVAAWGKGWCLVKTHCNTSYGKESQNPGIDTPLEVWADLLGNYVEKSFGGAATGYTLASSVNGGSTPTITYLQSPYKSNFEILNITLDLITAAQAGSASHQWYVTAAGTLLIKAINSTLASWTEYWKNSQAASTIEVTKDMILYDFRKNIEEYANKIVLCSAFRKPAEDYWTEDNGPTWGVSNCTATYSTSQYIVGSHSLLVEPTNSPTMGLAYHPSTRDAAWDLSKCGSPKTIPKFGFYVRANNVNAFGYPVYLFTDCTAIGGASDDYFWAQLNEYMTPRADKWLYIEFPVGPYWALDPSLQKDDGSDEWEWNVTGSPVWTNINGIALLLTGSNTYDKFFDDMHFSGKIIRDASDSSEISANNEYQRVIRNDTAVNDTLKASDDSEMAAQLAYAELLRRAQTPIVGMIQIPLAVDILPGQKIHVHACKQSSGTFRIDKDMRVVELKHVFALPHPMTILNLTDDLTNAHAFGVPTGWALLAEYAGALGHAEAKNLKGSGIDILISRLSKTY